MGDVLNYPEESAKWLIAPANNGGQVKYTFRSSQKTISFLTMSQGIQGIMLSTGQKSSIFSGLMVQGIFRLNHETTQSKV